MIRRSLAAATVLAVVTAGFVGTGSAVSAAGPAPIDLGQCFLEGGMALSSNGATAYLGCSTGGLARVNLATGVVPEPKGMEIFAGLAVVGDSLYATSGMSLVKISASGDSSIVRTFPPMNFPGAIAASPDSKYLVVGVITNYLSLVNATGSVIGRVNLAGMPLKVATYSQGDADYAWVIVNVEGAYKLQKVNLSRKSVEGSATALSGQGIFDLVMAPNGDFAYITQDDGKVLRISTATDAITTVATIRTASPASVAFTPDSGWAYVLGTHSGTNDPEVNRINTSNGALVLLPNKYNGFAAGIAVAPTGDKFYVSSNGEQNLLYTTAIAIPAVTGLTPARVSLFGGDSITITGRNLDSLQSLTVGGKDCPVASSSSNKIVCTVPAGPVDKSGSVDVIVKTSDGRTVVSGMLSYVLDIDAPSQVDAFTSAKSALIYFGGSSLKSAYFKGYQISMQSRIGNGVMTPWDRVKMTSSTATALTLTRTELGVAAGDYVRFRVNTVAKSGDLSAFSAASPWRQMTDTVATPTGFTASYDAKADYLTMRWDEPRGEVVGGSNVHGYEFQYMWPGTSAWVLLGDPLRGGTTTAVFSLSNVPKGTLKVRIRAISWPEKYLSDWTAEAAIRK
jgi:hypothetical protein